MKTPVLLAYSTTIVGMHDGKIHMKIVENYFLHNSSKCRLSDKYRLKESFPHFSTKFMVWIICGENIHIVHNLQNCGKSSEHDLFLTFC